MKAEEARKLTQSSLIKGENKSDVEIRLYSVYKLIKAQASKGENMLYLSSIYSSPAVIQQLKDDGYKVELTFKDNPDFPNIYTISW